MMAGEIHVKVPEFVKVKSIHSIIEVTVAKNVPPIKESHAYWEFIQLKRGTFKVQVDGKRFHLEPGEVLCYAPHTFHIKETPCDCDISTFSFFADASILHPFANRTFFLTEKQQALFDEILERGKHFFSRYPSVITAEMELIQPEEGYPILQYLANLMELFLIDLYETALYPATAGQRPTTQNVKNLRDEQFERVRNFLKDHIYENLTLEQISTGVNIGSANLQKLCNAQCGCGPISYFLLMKIGMAKQLMSDTSLNFTQIAERLGFSSVHYFSKLFKSKTGMTPSEYAKSLQ